MLRKKEENQMVMAWINGAWTKVADDRPEEKDGQCYNEWMELAGYRCMQIFGNPEGYGYALWAHKRPGKWFVCITDGEYQEDVLVTTMIDLAELMSKLGPGAMASLFDGEELSYMWAERAKYRETRENIKDVITAALRGCNDPDCPGCKARREHEEKLAEEQRSRTN